MNVTEKELRGHFDRYLQLKAERDAADQACSNFAETRTAPGQPKSVETVAEWEAYDAAQKAYAFEKQEIGGNAKRAQDALNFESHWLTYNLPVNVWFRHGGWAIAVRQKGPIFTAGNRSVVTALWSDNLPALPNLE